MRRFLSLGVFAVMSVSAPIAFGAVDRLFQVILVGLLALGLYLTPPSLPPLGRRALGLTWILGGILVAKEFLPYPLFGHAHWRLVLTEGLGLPLTWMHNPEPARALDSFLVILIAATWFIWVRTLAATRENRTLIAWTLFLSAGILAACCLCMPKGSLIYGIRMTPGWMGFGPFPNRNHTASFLAMGMLVGIGCCVHVARRRKFLPLFGGLSLLGLIFFTLIQSKSRGGISACAIGLVVYALLAISRGQDRKTFAVVGAAGLTGFGLFMAFGAGLVDRFKSGGDLPTNLRWGIWHDAIGMWKDAPLLGHGVGSFAQVFPLYQTVTLENQIVLHPESSWLQWLTELGLLPVAILVIALLWLCGKHLHAAFTKKHGFLAHAAVFAAVATMIVHCFWDVPGHRWATAGFALAALALACPMNPETARPLGIRMALIPLGICLFWALPFVAGGPAFSPTVLNKLLQRLDIAAVQVPSKEVTIAADYFPLTPELHHAMGMRWLNSVSTPANAWKHFQIADRLRPGSWSLPAAQALASQRVSPGTALNFWTVAIERAGHRNTEIFRMAYRRTISLPIAPSFWARYAETNPELLLTYAECLPEADARYYYAQWVKARSQTDQLGEDEVASFYAFASRFGDLAQFTQWMTQHPSRESTDFRSWAKLLHQWGDNGTAWKLLSTYLKEPTWPAASLSTRTEILEANWLKDPTSVVNAQALADAYHRVGDVENCKRVILASAKQKNAPTWFLQKAAFIQAADNQPEQAVNCMLRIAENP